MYTVKSKDGTSIAYDKTGSGPALILVGGAFSFRKFQPMVELSSLLSEHFTVYNYDRRGRGDSQDHPSYTVDKEIDDLKALIQEAGGSAYVWGLSSGAVLALQAAAAGANIFKLALHEPPFIVDAADRQPPSDFLQQLNQLVKDNRRSDAIRYFMTKGMGVPSIIVSMMRLMPKVWSNLMAVAHTTPYDAALLDGYMNGKPLPASNWSTLRLPTIVLEGTESPAAIRRASQALAGIIPNAQLKSKKGLGHTKQLHANNISKELVAFFK